MVKWAKKLYFDEHMKTKSSKTIKAIGKGKLRYDVYGIVLAMNKDNLFDIINVNELKFPYYKNKEICILGLARGREEAKFLVRDMVEEVYQKTGDVKVREFFDEWWD